MNNLNFNPNDDKPTSVRMGIAANPVTQVNLDNEQWLALGAVIGPILFTLAWFILGFLSPGFTLWGTVVSPYSPISQPISGLGLGVTAPYMNAAFVINGILIMIGAAGIFRSIREMSTFARWGCTLLLALTGLGMVMAGIFTLEEILPHTAGFLLGTGTPVLSFLVIGLLLRRMSYWRRFGSLLLVGSPLTLVLLVTSFGTFDPVAAGDGLGVAGLAQRILVTEVLIWIAIMGWKAFRRS